MFEVSILKTTTEVSQSEFDTMLNYVPPGKQERIKKFHFNQDAVNCLLGDILARDELSRFTDMGIEQIEFMFNEYGKPFILGKPSIQFNISHAGNYIACVIADEPVGIDIELIKNADMKIAERCFTPDETMYIMDGQQNPRFYEVWTKKESQIKWEGKGSHKPLLSFSVFESSGQVQLTYHNVFQNDEAICHVCSTKQKPPVVRIIDTTEFINVSHRKLIKIFALV